MCLQMLSASSMAAQILLFFQADFVRLPPPPIRSFSFERLLGTSRRWPATTSLLNHHNQNTIFSPFFTSIARKNEPKTFFNNPAIRIARSKRRWSRKSEDWRRLYHCSRFRIYNIAGRATQSNSVYESVLQISTVLTDGVSKSLCQNFFFFARAAIVSARKYIIFP